jgi:hypothetical protein
MAIGNRQVSFTFDVDSGAIVDVVKGADVVRTGPDPRELPGAKEAAEVGVGDEIAAIKRGEKRYKRIAEIIQTQESPGCVYWDGVRWVKYC